MTQKPKYPNRIYEIRQDRGLSQERLAQLANTTNQQIGRLEKGNRRLTYEWMIRLAEALECHWSELVDEVAGDTDTTEQNLLETFRGLPESQRETLLNMADYLAESQKPYKPKK